VVGELAADVVESDLAGALQRHQHRRRAALSLATALAAAGGLGGGESRGGDRGVEGGLARRLCARAALLDVDRLVSGGNLV